MSLASHTFDAFGSSATVHVTDPSALERACSLVESVVEEVDRACSRFRSDSELTRLNASSGRWMRVSPTFLAAVGVALRAARLTDGDLDPTIGGAVIVSGYDRSFVEIDEDGPALLRVERIPGWKAIRIDHEGLRVMLAPGCTLDLGATAKAFASDLAAQRVAASLGSAGGVAVSFGGDVSVAGTPPIGGWKVGIAEHHAGVAQETIAQRCGGIATSTTTVRTWVRGGREMHHLIDPRTGFPAEVIWRTATVAAATCVDANIAASTSIIRGQSALPWLESLELPARLVGADGVVATTRSWPSGL